jgi:hypothetical protein
LVGTERLEDAVAEAAPPQATGAADPMDPWCALVRSDVLEAGGEGETGVYSTAHWPWQT